MAYNKGVGVASSHDFSIYKALDLDSTQQSLSKSFTVNFGDICSRLAIIKQIHEILKNKK